MKYLLRLVPMGTGAVGGNPSIYREIDSPTDELAIRQAENLPVPPRFIVSKRETCPSIPHKLTEVTNPADPPRVVKEW